MNRRTILRSLVASVPAVIAPRLGWTAAFPPVAVYRNPGCGCCEGWVKHMMLIMAAPGSVLLYCFAIFYGAGMGIKTIVQATAAPEFLGREGYGALQGTFAGINYAIQAATPFALALLWSVMGGYDQVIWVLFGGAALSALAFIGALMVRPNARAASA
jgi:hypothetical protein